MKHILAIIFGAIIFSIAKGATDWFSIFYRSNDLQKVNANPVGEIDSLYYSMAFERVNEEGDSIFVPVINVAAADSTFVLPVDSIDNIRLRGNIGRIYIVTDSFVDEITDKENYLTATFRYEAPTGQEGSFETTVDIKSRGNNSWYMPKKPYRLKFSKKQSFPGLNKAKSFVLLANYLDNTLMKNAVAFKTAELLEMPYSNKVIPVEVYLNGVKKGNYMLTNKIGINSGSVDIDEEKGVLWELDLNYDEVFKFKTTRYSMPAMMKDPDVEELAGEDDVLANAHWTYLKSDLNLAMAKIYAGKWDEVLDAEQFVKYIFVNNLTFNREIGHPKSMFLYKTEEGEKYCFGPVWDFDWALGFTVVNPGIRFITSDQTCHAFYNKIFETDTFKELFQKELDSFCEEKIDRLMEYIDSYREEIRISALQDAELWPADHQYEWEPAFRHTGHLDENVDFIKNFILRRLDAMRADYRWLLY